MALDRRYLQQLVAHLLQAGPVRAVETLAAALFGSRVTPWRRDRALPDAEGLCRPAPPVVAARRPRWHMNGLDCRWPGAARSSGLFARS